ncbi:hypothetical protein [Caulobacter sp. S45]|uniref:hypothetical protein n=1 Tax=Caulobacter sp. S45 TaxID=1641861 RepID=UPI001575E0AA|nr:hypothetical protein [Caulobacter sp. S45]
MRRLATALFALATLALGAAPLAAHAADKEPITKDQRDKGMKDAPVAIQKAGIACTVSDAYYLGASSGKGGKSDLYEVACQQGLGYVLLEGAATTKAYDCLATASQPSLVCRLPANANPKQGLKPYIASAAVACTPTNARYLGANATTTVYEVACQEGPGYLLQAPVAPATNPVVAVPCLQAEGSANTCTLTSKTQSTAVLNTLVTQAGKTCQISADRFIGNDPRSGDAYYEVGCGAQPGFVIAATKGGGLDKVITCGQAQGLGGCTLSDSTQVMAQESAGYSQRAKAAGFNCDVAKYRSIGLDSSGGEVVELACSNRPDGTVAIFPKAATGRAQFVDCVKAGEFGPSGACTLTSPAPVYEKYNAALMTKNRGTCKVSGARYIGQSPHGDTFIETSCVDGKPGWVMEFSPSDQVRDILTCGQAKAAGVACQLPTNVHS